MPPVVSYFRRVGHMYDVMSAPKSPQSRTDMAAVVATTPTGTITYWPPSAVEFYGINPMDAIGQNISSVSNGIWCRRATGPDHITDRAMFGLAIIEAPPARNSRFFERPSRFRSGPTATKSCCTTRPRPISRPRPMTSMSLPF